MIRVGLVPDLIVVLVLVVAVVLVVTIEKMNSIMKSNCANFYRWCNSRWRLGVWM